MPKKVYFEEHIKYLREISPGRYNDEIMELFNERFGMNVTVEAIRRLKTRNKIKSNVSTNEASYTTEQLEYLRKLANEGLFNIEIAKRFNEEFNLDKTALAIKSIRAKHNIRTSARKQYKKGNTPWNKGTKGLTGANVTSFKKGNRPYNYVPVGSVRVNGDDYVDIKIEDPNVWRAKHVLIWEEHNGPVPDGHAIIFGDKNNRNFSIDNLVCVSRRELLTMNRHGLIKEDVELTKTGLIVASIYQKINDRKSEKKAED